MFTGLRELTENNLRIQLNYPVEIVLDSAFRRNDVTNESTAVISMR